MRFITEQDRNKRGWLVVDQEKSGEIVGVHSTAADAAFDALTRERTRVTHERRFNRPFVFYSPQV